MSFRLVNLYAKYFQVLHSSKDAEVFAVALRIRIGVENFF